MQEPTGQPGDGTDAALGDRRRGPHLPTTAPPSRCHSHLAALAGLPVLAGLLLLTHGSLQATTVVAVQLLLIAALAAGSRALEPRGSWTTLAAGLVLVSARPLLAGPAHDALLAAGIVVAGIGFVGIQRRIVPWPVGGDLLVDAGIALASGVLTLWDVSADHGAIVGGIGRELAVFTVVAFLVVVTLQLGAILRGQDHALPATRYLAGAAVAAFAWLAGLLSTAGATEPFLAEVAASASLVLLVAGALHPSARVLTGRTHAPASARERPGVHVAVLAAAMVVPLVGHALQGQDAHDGLPITVAVSALVLWRMLTTRREIDRARRMLARSEALFRSLTEASLDAFVILDPDQDRCRIRYASPAIESLVGRPAAECVGRSMHELVHPDDVADARDLLARIIAGAATSGRVRLRFHAGRGGRGRWVEAALTDRRGDPDLGGIVATLRDVTETVDVHARLRDLAAHDHLTGLLNRDRFVDHLDAVLGGRADGVEVGIFFLDLDHFKALNDGLGHAAGDRALRIAGERLRATVRPGDAVARFGGDEFLVLARVDRPGDVVRVGERLLHALAQPMDVGTTFSLGASIGAVISRPGTSGETLLQEADLALYRAKQLGRGRLALFDESLRDEALDHFTMVSALQHALRHDELRLDLQPLVDIRSGQVTGFEALVRWDRDGAVVSPAEFIPVAEASGLIVPVGCWVLDQACAATAELAAASPWLSVGVNLSPHQLADPQLVDTVTGALRRHGIPASRLVVEVTETAIMADLPGACAVLARLRDLGVRVAVDDFGTGQASLSYLKHLPVDVLKIDRSFIAQLSATAVDRAIVGAIVDLGHAIGLEVVAEGVETDEQLAAATGLGCDTAQGYLFAEPGTAAEMIGMVGGSLPNGWRGPVRSPGGEGAELVGEPLAG